MSTKKARGQQGIWAVKVEGMCKYFGQSVALRNVNLEVPYQNFVTIIGPNGAGKTTLIRILSTLSHPSKGRVWVDGLDLREWGAEIRRRIGFVAHQTMLYGDLSAVENLRFYGRIYGVPNLEERIHELIAKVELTEWRNNAVRTLSRGMQQRLSIVRAILHNPSIVFLDEPYTGLDQHAAEILSSLLRELLAEGHTILMTTHDLARGAEMANEVFILLAGQVVYQASALALSGRELHDIYRQYVEGHQWVSGVE